MKNLLIIPLLILVIGCTVAGVDNPKLSDDQVLLQGIPGTSVTEIGSGITVSNLNEVSVLENEELYRDHARIDTLSGIIYTRILFKKNDPLKKQFSDNIGNVVRVTVEMDSTIESTQSKWVVVDIEI